MALLKSLATVSGLTLSSRLLGFARQVLVTGVVGGLVVAVGAIIFTLIGQDVQTSLGNMQNMTNQAATQSAS